MKNRSSTGKGANTRIPTTNATASARRGGRLGAARTTAMPGSLVSMTTVPMGS